MNDQASPSETNESPLSGGAMDGSSQSTLQPVESPAPLIPPPPASEATQDAGHDPVPQQTPSARSSWSAGSGRQPGHSPDLSDRVFPIRSVVSVNPAGRTSGEHGYFPRMPDHGQYTASRPDAPPRPRRSDSVSQPAASAVTSPTGDRQATRNRRKHTSSGPISSIQADAARHANSKPLPIFESGACGSEEGHSTHLDRSDTSQPSHAQPAATPADSVPDGHGLILPRFRHVMTDDGHAVITGRDAVLQHCEDEPIHTPGAVQGFGLLLALREDQEGGFSVRYTSENSERIIGYSPKQLFNLASFLDILSEEQQDNLLDHIDFIRDEDADPATNGPEVFSLTVRSSRRKSTKLWCAIHINPAHPDLIICEFELDDDHLYPLRPADEVVPDAPEDTLRSDPTMEELSSSTEILSKPLRVLRTARRQRGEAGAMQVFDIMSQVQEQLAAAPSLDSFLKVLVGIVKELTGFHRVMIYQFDSSFNGKVVTELVDTSHTRDLYRGLHFPASDIPRQARDLYKLNKVRLLYDRDVETARLVCKTQEDLDVPLDMSHAYLRAMSPIHLKYLKNMAVRSSMSISINAFNELWGLIACHSYGPKGMRVSFPIRKMCRLVGDTASRNIERLSYASRLQARKLINTAPSEKSPSGYIVASSDDLLKLFDADFGMLSIHGETKILGPVEESSEPLAMLEYLRMRHMSSVVTTQDIREDFPDLHYKPGFVTIAGLLYVPLSVGGTDFIVFFRRGQVKEVKWAGNPYEKILREGTEAYLEPRKSFKTWHETVVGKCRDWTEEQVETAAVLCLVYGKFIEVWRQKEAALQSSKLTKLLLANSAHEVRTPLNAIINYLEIALEGSLDQETRDNLAKSHSASKSLIYVINDLLDLTKTEEGQDLVKDEIFALSSCIHEATDPFKNEAKRKAIEYEIIEDPGLPSFVYGDSRRVRQAISNVTANAVQHTDSGSVKVQLYVAEVQEQRVLIEVLIQDTGRGMSPKQLDALFRDLEQVNPDSSRQLTADDDSSSSDKRTLGLGLALVARIIRNMNGQLRLKSEEGKGSTFVMQLPFDIPDESPSLSVGSGQQSNPVPDANSASATKQPQRPSAGEIVLVDAGTAPHALKSPGETTGNVIETGSFRSQTSSHFSGGGSKGSRTSVHSSLSDAERLIDAIQTPLGIGEHVTGSPSRHRAVKGRHDDSGINVGADAASTARSVSPATTRHSDPRSPGAIVLPSQQTTGFVSVRDTKTPIRPVKVPEEYFDEPQEAPSSSRVLYEIPEPTMQQQPQPAPSETDTATSSLPNLDGTKLQVLIAEDDPINLRVLRKRLEKAGHEVHHAVNGEECALSFREKSETFDVVLMDMQMPIVDGLASTKMIRSFEQSHENCRHSALAAHNGRVPVFAVSASLIEREKNTYADAGFDGWILKPVDFKRLHTLLLGIVDDNVRTSCLYQEGEWERGGWFHSRRCEAREPASDHDHAGGVGLETPQTGAEVAGQDEGLPAPEDAVNASGPETTES
ncbi:hypothetical protein VDGD_07462 [Verticillium dahliae]|nr:hypothetical protein VDGD_07462 [Verticillium dahliae]